TAIQPAADLAAERAPILDSRRLGGFALRGAAALGYAVILTPILFVCWLSFFSNEIVTFPPQGYTLRWFAHIFDQNNFVSGFITASLSGFDRSIEEAALNLGATPMQALLKVTLPVIKPGVVAAALFGFIISFGNLEMTLFLVAPGQTTLPIAILQYLQWRIDPTIAAVSLLQIVLIGAGMLVTDRYVKLTRVL